MTIRRSAWREYLLAECRPTSGSWGRDHDEIGIVGHLRAGQAEWPIEHAWCTRTPADLSADRRLGERRRDDRRQPVGRRFGSTRILGGPGQQRDLVALRR